LGFGVIIGPAAPAVAASKKVNPSDPIDIPIKHVISIFQENRSFDYYFGTYPGPFGIPMGKGVPTVCVPDPGTGKCVKPYLDHDDVN
jgi:phospholipase C